MKTYYIFHKLKRSQIQCIYELREGIGFLVYSSGPTNFLKETTKRCLDYFCNQEVGIKTTSESFEELIEEHMELFL